MTSVELKVLAANLLDASVSDVDDLTWRERQVLSLNLAEAAKELRHLAEIRDRRPNLWWIADSPDYSMDSLSELLLENDCCSHGDVTEVKAAHSAPRQWALAIGIAGEDGLVEDYEVLLFPTEAEARAAAIHHMAPA